MTSLAFLFNQRPLHASARQGLDMLMMAISLDQPSVAIYLGEAVWQLAEPTNPKFDPLKKIQMLPDLFDFEAFYVCADSLEQAGLKVEELRVPVRLIQQQEIATLVANSQHCIRFGEF